MLGQRSIRIKVGKVQCRHLSLTAFNPVYRLIVCAFALCAWDSGTMTGEGQESQVSSARENNEGHLACYVTVCLTFWDNALNFNRHCLTDMFSKV